jgi:hypothetical protein
MVLLVTQRKKHLEVNYNYIPFSALDVIDDPLGSIP